MHNIRLLQLFIFFIRIYQFSANILLLNGIIALLVVSIVQNYCGVSIS